MRTRHGWPNASRELPGLTLRRTNDDGGDAGICLIAFAPTPALAAEAADGPRAEGVQAVRMYAPAAIDLHVYPFWKPVLDVIADAGLPAPDCPRTLDLLGRAIHVDVSPLNESATSTRSRSRSRRWRRGVLA